MTSGLRLYGELISKGFRPKRRLGQNFLIDDNVREIVLEHANPLPKDQLLEIGAGNGVITQGLLEARAEVWAIEKDPFLFQFLKQLFGEDPRLHLIQKDVMHTDLAELPPSELISNLPYNITSPLLYKIWQIPDKYDKLLLMTQVELAERLTAKIGTYQYGCLTVLYNITHHVKILHRISRYCFRPVPKVDSALISLKRRDALPPQELRIKIKKVVEHAFCYRRKKVINALKRGLPEMNWEALWERLNIPPSLRAENITPDEWLKIAQACD